MPKNRDKRSAGSASPQPVTLVAKNYGHLTAMAAARLAQKSGVKQLLHHVSRCYHPKDVLAEAQAIFLNTVVVNDFDHLCITKDKPVVADNWPHGKRKWKHADRNGQGADICALSVSI